MTAGTDREIAGAAHTPGPWVAGKPDGSYHDVIRIYPSEDVEQVKPIAVCFQQRSAIMEVLGGATDETTIAAHNARLIAAAPDMYAALQGIKADAEEMIADIAADIQGGAEMPSEEINKWTRVIAALSKARG